MEASSRRLAFCRGSPWRWKRGVNLSCDNIASMFEPMHIKQDMEVTDHAGQHIGIVQEVIDDLIKLARSESWLDLYHCVRIDRVESIEDNRIYLKQRGPDQGR